MMQAKELENLLKTGIPIARTIGIQNLQLDRERLILDLPLQSNVNHKGTLFGGSLYSAGALSCYGLFLAGLRDHSISTNNIVISEGSMRYLAPVDQDAKVIAKWGSQVEREQFFKMLAAKNKARSQMKAHVLIADKICAEFTGQFVAQLENQSG